MRVRRLNREVTRLYDAEARKFGLTAGRANVLVAVATRPGVQANDLVDPLSMEKSTLSRNLARLEADGLVEGKRVGRGRHWRATPAGETRITEMYDDWQRVQSAAKDLLGALEAPLLARDG